MLRKLVTSSVLLVLITTTSYAQEPSFSQVYEQYNQSIAAEDYNAAVEYALQALQLGKVKYGENSENAVNLEYNLGLAYSSNGQTRLAFETLAKVADKFETLFGENSTKRFSALIDQIATAQHYKNAEIDKIYRQYRTAIYDAEDIADSLPDEQAQTKGVYYYELSNTLIKSRLKSLFFKQTFRILEHAQTHLLATVGEKDRRTVKVQFLLGKFSLAKGRVNSAIEYYETVVNIVDQSIDTSHPYELASRAALVNLYEKKGESEMATEHCIAIGRMTPWNDDIDPTPLYRKSPDYPESKARAGKDGMVVMSFDIDTSGFVINIKPIDEDGGESFVKKAVEALKQWRYAPKIVDGQAVVAKDRKVQIDFKIG